MKAIKTIVIDDEADSREIIRSFLKKSFPEIRIIAEANSVKTGIEILTQHTVDLVFLDIRLRGRSSFEILNQLESRHFDIIFITAYDEYAIKAIKHHAFDYLLKPINREEFKATVNHFLVKSIKEKSDDIQMLAESINSFSQIKQIKLPTLSGFKLVNMDDIIYLESDSNYTRIFMKNGNKILVSKSLKEYENLLPKYVFCRIHHSHIVNIEHVKEYRKGRGGEVVLESGTVLNVSQNRKANLIKYWN